MRSRIRVPWESEWRCDWKSKSRSLRSWCKSPPIQSPSLPFHGGDLKSPMKVEERRLGWQEEEKPNLAEGVPAIFIIPLIPNMSGKYTGHVRYLRADCSFSKFHSLNSNPLLCHFLIQKHVCPWSKWGVNTFLIQMPWVALLFSKYLAYGFWSLEREIVRHSRLWT